MMCPLRRPSGVPPVTRLRPPAGSVTARIFTHGGHAAGANQENLTLGCALWHRLRPILRRAPSRSSTGSRPGATTPEAEVARALSAIGARDGRLNAFSVVLAGRRARAGAVPRARARRGPWPAVRRTGRDQGGARRRRLRDDVRRQGQQHARGRGRRGRTTAPRGGRGRRRQDEHAGVRCVPVHRVGRARLHPQPVAHRVLPGRLQRRLRGGGGLGDGAGRRWVATAVARSGSRRRAAGCSG